LLRNLFGEDVLGATVWKSTAIANAGLTKQSLYELEKGAVGRAAYERAVESVGGANGEILEILKKVWREQTFRHDPVVVCSASVRRVVRRQQSAGGAPSGCRRCPVDEGDLLRD
jgi:hypothetical protein